MTPEIHSENYYAELAKWAGLAWLRSVAIEDQKPLALPAAVEFRPYAYYFDKFKNQQHFAKSWVSTNFRRVQGVLETFDAMINTHWLSYSKHAEMLVNGISMYVDRSDSIPSRARQYLFTETKTTIQRCKEDAKRIVEACRYLQNEMSRINFSGTEALLTNRTTPLDTLLRRLLDKIPEKNRGLLDDIDAIKKQIEIYDQNCAALTQEKERGSVWPWYYIVAGSVILVSYLILPGAIGAIVAIRFIPGLVVAGYVGVIGLDLGVKKKMQERIDHLKGLAAPLREGLQEKLRQVTGDPALCSYLTLQSERNLSVDTAYALFNANYAASVLIQYYEKKLGKFEILNGKQEFNLAGDIGELLNAFADNVKGIRPTSAQQEVLMAALAKFKPNPDENVVGWNFDVVFPGMKTQRQKTEGVAISGQDSVILSREEKAAARRFNKYFVFQQTMQFGAFQRQAPAFININALSHPRA